MVSEVWRCLNCSSTFAGGAQFCPSCGMKVSPPPRPATTARRGFLTPGKAVVGLIVVVTAIVLAGVASSHRSAARHTTAAENFCATATPDATTMAETTLELGEPDATVKHDGSWYLSYGKVTLAYTWLGTPEASPLTYADGCVLQAG